MTNPRTKFHTPISIDSLIIVEGRRKYSQGLYALTLGLQNHHLKKCLIFLLQDAKVNGDVVNNFPRSRGSHVGITECKKLISVALQCPKMSCALHPTSVTHNFIWTNLHTNKW